VVVKINHRKHEDDEEDDEEWDAGTPSEEDVSRIPKDFKV
jgi:hypothetical protein